MRSLLTCLVLCLLVPILSATVVVPAEFREVVTGSELIAYGRVIDVTPEWADGRRRIDSVITLDVISWFKGGDDRRLTFTVSGGAIGRYRSVLVGAPVFTPGDEAFVFLKTAGATAPYVYGLNQGVFRVRADGNGQRSVMPPLLATGVAAEPVRRGAANRKPIALADFTTQIRTVMAASRGAAQ